MHAVNRRTEDCIKQADHPFIIKKAFHRRTRHIFPEECSKWFAGLKSARRESQQNGMRHIRHLCKTGIREYFYHHNKGFFLERAQTCPSLAILCKERRIQVQHLHLSLVNAPKQPYFHVANIHKSHFKPTFAAPLAPTHRQLPTMTDVSTPNSVNISKKVQNRSRGPQNFQFLGPE